ncbi:MAG TPA: STAS domain-containing protein [Vicinamibacterales bacterium]|nr:STAS domain-containing protein [Vicinamibacterales bacterium]
MKITERAVGDVTILDLEGRLILDEGFEPLRVVLNGVIGQGRRKLLLNMERVTFLDSAGVGLVACKYVTLCRYGGELKLCRLRARTHEVLKVTKLLSVFESFDSEADALASFTSSAP